jgi:tetratricopeptide (TPR) repeat protein
MVQDNATSTDLYATDTNLSVSPFASKLAQLLNLFAAAPIDWQWVEIAAAQLQWTQAQVDDVRIQLLGTKFLQLTDAGFYQVDPVLREVYGQTLPGSQQSESFKRAFAEAIVLLTQQLPQAPGLAQTQAWMAAIPHITEVAEAYTQYIGAIDLNALFTTLGHFYTERKQISIAESWYQKGVKLVQARLGNEHPQTATSLNNLASFYQAQSRYTEAEPLFVQALAINQQSCSDRPELATSLNNLAGFYKVQGNYSQAESLYLQALELKLKLFGETHSSVATGLNNLAGIYYAQGRYGEAETLYERTLKLKKCLLGENHPSLATTLNNLASVYQAQKRYNEAKSFYSRAVRLGIQNFGKDHPTTLVFQRNLNKVCEMLATETRPTPFISAKVDGWSMVSGMRGLLGLNF